MCLVNVSLNKQENYEMSGNEFVSSSKLTLTFQYNLNFNRGKRVSFYGAPSHIYMNMERF